MEHAANSFAFLDWRANVWKCSKNFSVIEKSIAEPRGGLGIISADIVENTVEIG
jgi:hypothetical protein